MSTKLWFFKEILWGYSHALSGLNTMWIIGPAIGPKSFGALEKRTPIQLLAPCFCLCMLGTFKANHECCCIEKIHFLLANLRSTFSWAYQRSAFDSKPLFRRSSRLQQPWRMAHLIQTQSVELNWLKHRTSITWTGLKIELGSCEVRCLTRALQT